MKDFDVTFPSILECLVDEDPDVLSESLKTVPELIHDLKISIALNIKNILMTQRFNMPKSTPFIELIPSLLDYGLPDFTSYHLSRQKIEKLFIEFIKNTIQNYETRIQLFEILSLDNSHKMLHTLTFALKGTILMNLSEDLFEFVVDINTHSREVFFRAL